MASRCRPRIRTLALSLAGAALLAGCGNQTADPPLSKPKNEAPPNVPVPAAEGPKLGSVADLTPVYDRPATGTPELGYLHAGGQVARAQAPYSRSGCADGWYPIRPRGFVCAGASATVDLAHPTLAAMALGPKLDQALPYTFARTRSVTPVFERDAGGNDAVRELEKLKRGAGFAVVGSWTARADGPEPERLGLLTNGRFVKASDLEALTGSDFHGVELDEARRLPIAFVVKRGVRNWTIEGKEADKAAELDYHAIIPLAGRFRTLGDSKYWAAAEGKNWVRHRDVTVVQRRSVFPDFATETQRWIDVSVVSGTIVLYEGKKALYVTLASVARPALDYGETEPSPEALAKATTLGTFNVAAKHITLVRKDPKTWGENYEVYDVPWALELSSGQLLHGAYWHDRFGIEHGTGSIQVSPADALRIWTFATPTLPEGWHSAKLADSDAKTIVLVRK
jgi:hypothetical protein